MNQLALTLLILTTPYVIAVVGRRWAWFRRIRLGVAISAIHTLLLVPTGLVLFSSISGALNPVNALLKVDLPYSTTPRLTANNASPVPFKGVDYATFCGDTLYAPQTGWVSRKGVDRFCGAYGCYNTYIEFQNEAGVRTVMLHGDYDAVEVGDFVARGVTVVGTEASNGNSTGCHTDFWTNGDFNYETK